MTTPRFIEVPGVDLEAADVVLLPLPFEGTVSYGTGTARAPAAILAATEQTELWDEEVDFDFERLAYHISPPVMPEVDEPPGRYLSRVENEVRRLRSDKRLLIGLGGEHSLSLPLIQAQAETEDPAEVTVVQIDAHADLRDEYEGTKHSHACVMHRVVERGANVIAIGIRSAEREEYEYGRSTGRVDTYFAHELAGDPAREEQLMQRLQTLSGEVYLTFDVDGLEVHLCPATGTPQPGGLGWWQALRYLKALLYRNRDRRLIGADIVETVPQPGTVVNEFTAARLLCKIVAYAFADRSGS